MEFDIDEELLGKVITVLIVAVILVMAVAGLKVAGVIDPLIEGIGSGSIIPGGDESGEGGAVAAATPKPTTSVSVVQNTPLPTPPPGMNLQQYYEWLDAQQSSQASQTVSASTTVNSTAQAAAPIVPEDPYAHNLSHSRPPPLETPAGLVAIFSRSYTMEYDTAEGIEVDVDKGPLVIDFSVAPDRSDYASYECYVEITVRDAETLEIVQQNGYGREYSEETKKSIEIFDEGKYHITLIGTRMKVNVLISVGG
jgi:hypothetical protein